MDAAKLESYAEQYSKGIVDGRFLANLVEKNEITPQERRKIVKLSTKKKLEEDKRKEKADKISAVKKRTSVNDNTATKSVCLACRQPGHTVKTCPNSTSQNIGICFKCGSSSHILKDCPDKSAPTDLKFAKCFICNKPGHISRDCPDNNHGLYPSGGGCHICGGTNHLVRDCPNKRTFRTDKPAQFTVGVREASQAGDVEDFEAPIGTVSDTRKRPRTQQSFNKNKRMNKRLR